MTDGEKYKLIWNDDRATAKNTYHSTGRPDHGRNRRVGGIMLYQMTAALALLLSALGVGIIIRKNRGTDIAKRLLFSNP